MTGGGMVEQGKGKLEKREGSGIRETEEPAAARKSDLLMSVEIPRGSLGVPKHQRDCVSPVEVFHYQGERVPSFQFHPLETLDVVARYPRYSGARSPASCIDVQTDIADRSSGHRCKCAYSS